MLAIPELSGRWVEGLLLTEWVEGKVDGKRNFLEN